MPKKQVRGAEATPQFDSNRTSSGAQVGTIHKMVLETLEINPATRNSDRLLISEIYGEYYGAYNEAFWKVMEDDTGKYPSFETITRCRRKIQETRPDLRAVKEVAKERENRQMEFREYANGGVIA